MKDWTWRVPTQATEIDTFAFAQFGKADAALSSPLVIRGLASAWPLVVAGRDGDGAAAHYLSTFDRGILVKTMIGPPEINGRFFYDDAMRGYNFAVEQVPLKTLIDQLIDLSGATDAPSLYAGSTPTADCLPGFADANVMPLPTPGASPRIWIGNATHIAPHYDVSDNIAVVALGRRRFTFFPPSQTPNLYVGPLDITIAGQPVSMVDIRQPDLARFPRYADAMPAATYADLEPGDAVFVPSLWWHCVEAYASVNILVNYWYNAPAQSSPFAALVHAMLAVRDLPDTERDAWRVWFDHFVFSAGATAAGSHLPSHAQRLLGPPSAERADAIRGFVLNALARK